MLREKICNFHDVEQQKLKEGESIIDEILNTDFEEDTKYTIYYESAHKNQETLNYKPINPEDMKMANGNEQNDTAMVANENLNAQEGADMTELSNSIQAANQNVENQPLNVQEDVNMANAIDQNGMAQAQQETINLTPNAQEDVNMANGNDMAQAQQNSASQPLNAQTATLLGNNNGTAQAQHNAFQSPNPQFVEMVPYTADQEERIASLASKMSKTHYANFRSNLDTLRNDLNNNVCRKETKKKLNLNDREYRDLHYALCVIDDKVYIIPENNADDVRKCKITENGIVISKRNIEKIGAHHVFAQGKETIPSFDAVNNRIIISLYAD